MSVLDAIERSERLDPLTRPAAAFWSKVLAPQALRDVLSGKQLGHPLHPAAVLVPAGSFLSATVCDITGQTVAAQTLTSLGLASSVPTILAGWSDWLDTEGAEKRVGIVHAASNAVGVTAYLVSWFQRRAGRSGLAAGAFGSVALGVGGWLGGHLAYALGVGVDTTAFQHSPAEWTDVAADADVTSAPLLGDADGVPVLLLRHEGEVLAIADRCTHRGAPLHEGVVADGCVTCPWHDSTFRVTDGAVQRGPATRPQPVFEVRVADGRIAVRRAAEGRTLRTNPVGT